MKPVMKLFLIITLCLLNSCSTINNCENMTLKYGLYYGRNKGFFPQNIVYAKIDNNKAIIECYLPIKGEFFLTLSDTLSFVNNGSTLYSSKRSILYSKKGDVYFETIHEQNEYNIKKTLITYQPDKRDEYDEIKNKAKPFKK